MSTIWSSDIWILSSQINSDDRMVRLKVGRRVMAGTQMNFVQHPCDSFSSHDLNSSNPKMVLKVLNYSKMQLPHSKFIDLPSLKSEILKYFKLEQREIETIYYIGLDDSRAFSRNEEWENAFTNRDLRNSILKIEFTLKSLTRQKVEKLIEVKGISLLIECIEFIGKSLATGEDTKTETLKILKKEGIVSTDEYSHEYRIAVEIIFAKIKINILYAQEILKATASETTRGSSVLYKSELKDFHEFVKSPKHIKSNQFGAMPEYSSYIENK